MMIKTVYYLLFYSRVDINYIIATDIIIINITILNI